MGSSFRARFFPVAASALAFCSGLAAAMLPPGPQVVTYRSSVDDSDQPYALYVPPAVDPGRAYPVVISLHGENSNHLMNLRQVFGKGPRPGETTDEGARYLPRLPDVPFLVAAPLARGAVVAAGIVERDVYDMLADLKRRFPIDDDRIYLTGVSTGGGTALRLALTRPDVWAAVAAVCPVLPEGLDELLPNATNVPLRIYGGEFDPLVPASQLRDFQKRLLAAGVNVEYIEYPRVRHNAWDNAYRGGGIFEWFAARSRTRMPRQIHFRTRAYRLSSAWWIRIDRLTPGTPASIDASAVPGEPVTIATRNVDAFTVELRTSRIRIDGAVFTTRPAAALSFHRTPNGWRAGLSVPAAGDKRRGAEGPLARVITARHLYVYGTADNPPPGELERRRREAEAAATWSTATVPLRVSFPVVADRDVSPADAKSANLVLFGTAETNRLIARAGVGVPLALHPSAADYGLVCLAADNGRYLLINSGLPWWTGADQARRGAEPRRRPPYPPWRVLETFADFIVFKGSLENVVAEGRLENDWSIPPAAAATIKATGAVQLR